MGPCWDSIDPVKLLRPWIHPSSCVLKTALLSFLSMVGGMFLLLLFLVVLRLFRVPGGEGTAAASDVRR